MKPTWSAVRIGREGERPVNKGWCGHKHRRVEAAQACARRLARGSAYGGDAWVPAQDGHLRSTLPVDPVTLEPTS